VSALPKGWREVRLAELADTTLGKMLNRGNARGLPKVAYLRNVNVQWGRIDTHDLLTMELANEERDRFAVKNGDLLICEGGAIGRAAIWQGKAEYLAFQKALHRVRSRGELDLRFLRYLLELYSSNGVLARYATGSTIAHLPQQRLRELPVPLPPLTEQRRIVDILEDHFSRLDVGSRLILGARRRLGAWASSALDEGLWSRDAPLYPVDSLLSEGMRNGHSAPAVSMGSAGIRTLTLTAVTLGVFSNKYTKITSADPGRVSALWLQTGDILVQRSNTPELVGTTAMYEGPDNWAIYPDLLVRLRVNTAAVSSEYLAAVLSSERAHRQMRSKAKGLAGSMPKIDQSGIGSTEVPVPDENTQRAIVGKLREIGVMRSRLDEALISALVRSTGLRKALLAAAFSGQLTGRSTDIRIAEEMAGV